MIQITNPGVQAYVEQYTSPEDPVLKDLAAVTSGSPVFSEMLSGNFQGQLLTFLCSLLRPKHVLEIGTFTGYSAICMARGLDVRGKITTIEYNSELEPTIHEYLKKTGFNTQVELMTGNAMEIIPGLDGPFDLVFIDADKKNYLNYYKLVMPKILSGGVLLIDNVLWRGKVTDPSATDAETVNMRIFNDFVKNDDRVTKVMLPVRDGLYLVQKK